MADISPAVPLCCKKQILWCQLEQQGWEWDLDTAQSIWGVRRGHVATPGPSAAAQGLVLAWLFTLA